MTKRDKQVRKRLCDLIQWYAPEFKSPKRTAKGMLDDLKNIIENSNCLTCDEESDHNSEDEVIIKGPKRYPDRYWSCKICDKTMKLSNKCNHLRSKLHKIREVECE